MADATVPGNNLTQMRCKSISGSDPCIYPVVQDGSCIFHLTKLTSQEKIGLTQDGLATVENLENNFRESLDELMRQIEADAKSDGYNFFLFEFPSVNFRSKVFKKKCDFTFSKFKQGADFAEATFEHEAHFSACSIIGEASFRAATFYDGAYFDGVTFHGANFGKATFCTRANFNHAKFEGEAFFYDATFGDKQKVQSYDESDFESAAFKKDTNFVKATFNTKTSFKEATFEDVVYFAETTFEKATSFEQTNFKQKATFWRHSFNQNVDFTWATFGQEVMFSFINFKEAVIFDGVTVALRTSFEGTDERSFEKGCSFRWLRIPQDALVTFEHLNLEKATFIDSDLTRIVFRDVKWYHPSSRWNGWHRRRVALRDEFREMDDEQRGYEKVAENYHQLVLNYELKRDYNTAEDFHIGEMETQRKKRGAGMKAVWRRRARQWVNPYGLYWLFSNYGSSYWQAFLVLVRMLLIFSLIFLYSGFQPSKESAGGSGSLIEYNFSSDAQHHAVAFSQWIADYARAILFSLSIITFQRERFYEPVGDWSRFWLFLAVLFLTAQAAMVLLAIRRRFKR